MAQLQQLSRSAYDRLAAEHHDLTTRGRIELSEIIQRAREMGDLSENGDYQAAKDQQGHMEGRIRQLESIIENAEIIEGGEAGVVSVGSIVTIVYEGDSDDMAERYLLDSVEQRGDGVEVVSPKSPLGEALVGARTGDVVSYTTPTGAELRVTLKNVEVA